MTCFPTLAACALALGLAGLPARAQPAARPSAASDSAALLPLRAALDAAWQRAVAAREADGQRHRAEADRLAAGRPWAAAPTLELSHRDDRLRGRSGGRETELGLAVPLWLPGQRATRVGTADAAVAQALAGEQVARLRLAGEVREAAWQVGAHRAEWRQAQAQARALQQLADDVDRRVRAGDLARADSLAARADWLAASAAEADVRQRLHAAQARWGLLTGSPAGPDLTQAVAGVTAPDPAADLDRHPEWQYARQATEGARQRVALMRHSRRDAPELSLGVRQDRPGGGEASQSSLVVGLRLPFGTDERNLPLEVAALSELEVAQTHEQRLRERLASDIAAAREARHSAQRQLESETERASLLRERAVLIDKSFLAGETPLPDLLRALAAASQAESAVARQTAALGLAHARLQQALGLLP